MSRTLHKISEPPIKLLPILSDEEAGEKYSKWSYVNIYSLKDLKDIYLINLIAEKKTVKEITKKVNDLIVSKDKWEERKVLEYLNALVKFGLLSTEYDPIQRAFESSHINDELNESDIRLLKEVFFKYFRFKELSSWFISPDKETHDNFDDFTEADYILLSKPLFFCNERNRFTDTFFTDIGSNQAKYIIESDIVMRFWDVYLKWGTTLNVLDKFNIAKTGERSASNKEISVAYFIRPFVEFDLLDFITQNFNSKQILMPHLIYKIVKKYRYSVFEIKDFIISEILKQERLTYERTSEIFLIKGKTSKKNIEAATYLFPKLNNSYISHLILRK